MTFFTIADIKNFAEIAGQTYRNSREEDVRACEEIKQGVWGKTKHWAGHLRKQLGNTYKVDFKMIWSQRGWEDGKHVSTFKKYTWARVYKTQDANKDIYYTVGVDGSSERLIVKLDYQRDGKTTLSKHQAQLCHQLIRPDSEQYWISVSLTDLQSSLTSWDALINKTIATIQEYESTYDLIISLVWPTVTPVDDLSNPTKLNAFEPGSGPNSSLTVGRMYTRPERIIQSPLIHLQISLLLYKHLAEKYGFHTVRREWPATHNTTIDMARQENDDLILYEIKTYPSVRACIREAVGQLLEYSYWPGQPSAKELIIVTPHPATQGVNDYMHKLHTTLCIPIRYQQFDLNGGILVDD